MDLWIRSQDRTMLCKPQYIELCCDSEVHYGDVNIGYRCVATYKTKERALEVLDEIQGKITQNECLKQMMPKVTDIRGYEEKFGKLFKETIYEMPKE